jgi:hypothetical protein
MWVSLGNAMKAKQSKAKHCPHTGSLHATTDKPQAAIEACISTLCLASWDSEVTVKLAGPCSWTMKLAGDLVGVKPLPSFTAAWWEETKRTGG